MTPLYFAVLSALLLCGTHNVDGQSNYAQHGNSIEYQGNGLPEETVLDGKVTKLDDLSPVIFLNRTKAALNCAAGTMEVDLKFNEPFFGIAYADFKRDSPCKVVGKGNLSYHLELPLKGCNTVQKPQRVFTNNIVVRFHHTLEMDGDEVITIVCRYPPPIAPLPAALPAPILEPIPPIPQKPPIEGYQILLIICAILFLSLMLLGLGCSYYCLNTRRVHRVVHRHPFSSIGTGSEITKLSGSSHGNISMFEGLKIPRAHAPATATASTSSSEQALIPSEHSDTLPSDYPSESPSSAHSEVEDIDTRSLGSYNHAFIPDPEPKFDVQVRVKRAPPPPPISPSLSSSDVESVMAQQARNLTTILEREENVRSMDIGQKPNQAKLTSFTYVPDLHPAPAPSPPGIYSRVVRKERIKTDVSLDLLDNPEVERVQKKQAPPPPSILPLKSYKTDLEMQTTHDLEPPLVVMRRPEITSHIVDDVFLRTITEKKTIEDIERHKRLVTEYHAKPVPVNPKWDVTIRNYPAPGQVIPTDPVSDWDSYSETSTVRDYPVGPSERYQSELNVNRNYKSQLNIPAPDPPVHNWDVLIRVLEPPPVYTTTEEFQVEEPTPDILTVADKEKWRQIITTESTLRTLLTEAVVREDYERIIHDQRYEQIFEPKKWDVIIRILAPPEKVTYDKNGQPNNLRYKRKQDWDNRSRRSSLPTLYEYDSDGGSSVRTLVPEHGASFQDMRNRKSSRSSFRSDGVDVRSMTEVVVDYSRADRADTLSDVSSRPSSYYRHSRQFFEDDETDGYGYTQGSMVRSLSQPSLARSASEFTEHWTARKWDPETTEPSSPEHSPRSVRSGRTSIAGSTVSTQRRRQAIINKTLGTDARNLSTTSGLSRSSESVLEPNEAITPFNRRENELYSTNRLSKQETSVLSKSDGRLDEMERFQVGAEQQTVYRTTKTSSETVKQTKFAQGWR